MNKRALLLTAATAALLSGPAFAANPTHISTATTTALKTSTVNAGAPDNIVIDAAGSVTITSTTPVITIDSSNTVSNSGTLSNKDTNSAVGVKIDLAAGALTGSFDNIGKIELTGTGISKVGVLLSGSNIFTGDLTFEGASQVNVTGDGSIGLQILNGVTLNGDLTIDGGINMGSATATTPASNATAVRIDGDITGDVSIGGTVTAIGPNAQGFVMTGDLTGSFTVGGSIVVRGTNAPTTSADPEAGVALAFAGNITQGILLDGRTSPSDSTPLATVESRGNAQAIFISPAAGSNAGTTSIVIGVYDDPTNTGFSFVNRGTVTSAPIDPNLNSIAFQVAGVSSTILTTFTGGFFNSGSLNATATTDSAGSSNVIAVGVWFSNFANVPSITNNGDQASLGIIGASVSGEKGGSAYAIRLENNANNCPSACSPMSIINSGTISAIATTSDTTNGTLNAYAIYDLSGSVNNITNSGTIRAFATPLDGDTQNQIAALLSSNTTGVTFTNSAGASILGDVIFGSGSDTFIIGGLSNNPAAMTGDIRFDGGSDDQLHVNSYGVVVGAVTELLGSNLDINVQAQGILRLTNDISSGPSNNFNVNADNFKIEAGGALGMLLSEGYNGTGTAFVQAKDAELQSDTLLNLTFGSFLTIPAGGASQDFILIDTPLNHLTIGNLAQLQDQVCSNVSFFFSSATNCLTRVDTATDSQLLFSLTPKTNVELGLKPGSFAFDLFDQVNAALVQDDELGAAVIAAGLPVQGVPLTQLQGADLYNTIYSAFAPDVTGSSRAIVVSLTDQATGPVAARQRALRMYAAQQGSVTMWGQEFAQRLNATGNDAGGQYRNTGFGFVLGLDGGDPNNGRYGGAFTFYTGDTSEQAPRDTKTSSEWYMLTAYSDWRGKGLFFDSQASLGYGTLNGKRYLNIGSVSRVADSSRTGLMFAGGFTTGVVFAGGGTVFTPQFSVDGMTMREDGYSESGGGTGVNLKVEPYYAKSLRAYVGTSLRQDLNFGDFYLQPEARVGYRYDFLSDPATIKAAFASVPLSQFSLTGPDPGKGNFVAGGSLAVTTGAWSIGLNYDLTTSSGNVSHSGTIMLTGRI